MAEIAGAGLGVKEAAPLAGVSHGTITRLKVARPEAGHAREGSRRLEAAGIIFVGENGERPGVRLRKSKGARAR